MKSLYLSLFVCLLFIACNEDEEPATACGNFSAVTFEEFFNEVLISYGADFDLSNSDHQMQYGIEGFSIGSGTTITTNSCCQLSVDELEFGETYDFYFDALCEGGTNWEGPFKYTLENSPCGIPVDLQDFNNGMKPHVISWFTDLSAPVQPSLFQLEYGEKDFSLGSGTNVVINNGPYSGGRFEEGKVYDFYVKSDCNGVEDSPWVGPVSFIAEGPQNQCLIPENLTVTNPVGAIKVRIRFDGQGDCRWEGHIQVGSSTPPDNPSDTFFSDDPQFDFNDFTGADITIGYSFFVRAICDDGSHSDWSESVSIQI